MEIANRVFVVTGGGNGIGREVVLALLAHGGRVAALDLREEGLAETGRLAGAAVLGAGRLTTHVVDVTDRAAVEALPQLILAAHGQVDGVLNVAGIIQQFTPFADLSYEEIRRVMDVNFWGVVHVVKTFLPLLSARPAACIVDVSSMGGLAPVPGQTVYGASKAAVKLLTEGLYAELRDTAIAVTVVFPGGVSTGITENSGVKIPGGDRSAESSSMALTTPKDAAAQIVKGVEKGSYRVVIGKDAHVLDGLSRLAPKRATDFVAAKMKSLLDS